MAEVLTLEELNKIFGGTLLNNAPVGKDFVKPVANADALRAELVRQFSTSSSIVSTDFIKKSLSLNLSELSVKTGVSLSRFVPQPDDSRNGFFTGKSNNISIRDEFFSKPENIAYAIHTASHEATHKRQQELNSKAKYFGPMEGFMKVGEDSNFSQICGFNQKDACYYMYRIEREAFKYSKDFTLAFLDDSLAAAESSGNTERANFIRSQKEKVITRERLLDARIKETEDSFVSGGVKNYAEKVSSAFEKTFSLAKALTTKTLSEEDKKQLAVLSNLEQPYSSDPILNSFYACAVILSRYPKREYIEQMMDFAISSNVAGMFGRISFFLTDAAVRLTESDISRMILGADMFRGADSKFSIIPHTLSRIDETMWVKNMLLSHGVAATKSYIEKLKQENGFEYPFDFKVIDSVVDNFVDKPLLAQPNGYKFYGCSEILSYALDRAALNGKIDSRDILTAKVAASKVLSNIMQRYNFDHTNPEFISALVSFTNDPFKMQFEDQDIVSEYSYAFNPKVSETIQLHIQEGRQKTEGPEGPIVRKVPIKKAIPVEEAAIVEAKEKFAQDVINLRRILSKEEFADFIKSLNLTDSSRNPVNSEFLEVLSEVAPDELSGFRVDDSSIIPAETVIDKKLGEGELVLTEGSRTDTILSDVSTEYANATSQSVVLIDGTKAAASASAIIKVNSFAGSTAQTDVVTFDLN